jgi:hydroxyacylglutathione hydrolase
MRGIARIDAPVPIIRVTGRVFPSNAYLLPVDAKGGCLLVDPGLDGELIAVALAEHGLVPRAIVCTHGHFDHLGSASEFQRAHDVPVYLHEADMPVAKASNFLLMAMKIARRIMVPEVEPGVRDGYALVIGDVEVRFRSTPGHTPGSAVITLAGLALTGDTIYSRGVGLSGLPGENIKLLKASIHGLFAAIADDVLVLPGHGPEAPLGDIKRSNVALQQFLGSPVSAMQGH